jgi:hypothetical protein
MHDRSRACVQGAVQLARAGHRVQGGRRLEPELLRGAHRVRVRGRRAGVRGAHAARRRRGVGADAAVVGRRVAVQLRRHPAGALLRPPHLRLRQDGRRQQRHPRGVDARRHVPLGRQLRQLTRTDGRTDRNNGTRARPPAGRRDGRERRGVAWRYSFWFMIRAVRGCLLCRRRYCTVACVTCTNRCSHRVPPDWCVFV